MPRTIEMNAVLTERRDLAPGLALLRFEPEGWELPAWQAGQYCMLGLSSDAPRHPEAAEEERPAPPGRLIKRAYSPSSAPGDGKGLELYVSMVPSGQLSPRLMRLEVGDRAWLGPKLLGDFTLEVPEGKNVALVGTGTGLAPYLSMVRAHARPGDGRRWLVFHGVRTSAELGFRSELESLAAGRPDFRYVPCLDQPEREAAPWGGATGWVQDHWRAGAFDEALGGAPSPETTHVFLCGNPAMIAAMTELLLERGWTKHARRSPGTLHTESYW